MVWGLKKEPSVLCHLNFAANPPPTQKTLPFQVQLSCARQATKGTTKLGLTSFKTSGGITVSSILDAASGAIVLTLTLRFSPSLARAMVNPWSANLAIEQLTCPKLPNKPAAEAVLMTRPYPCYLMMFQAALVHLQAPKTWTLQIKFQSSSFIFWKETSLKIPALLIRTSTFPKLSVAVLIIFYPNSTESQLATATPPLALISQTTLSAALLLFPCPLCEVPKSLTTTLAPLEAKNKAYYFPIPPPAPVTTTTLPSNLNAIYISLQINNDIISFYTQLMKLTCPNKQDIVYFIYDISLSFAFSNVKSKKYYVAILNNILFTLLNVFSLSFHHVLVSQFHQIVVFHYLRADKSFFKVSVDDSGSLRCLSQFPNRPATNLISTRSEEINQVQGIVSCFNDLGNHSPFLFILIFHLFLLKVSTIGNDFPRNMGIDPFFYLLQPLVLFNYEIITAEVNQIDDRFSSNKSMSIQNSNLIISPFSMTNPFVIKKQILSLRQNLFLFLSLLGVCSFDDFFKIFQSV